MRNRDEGWARKREAAWIAGIPESERPLLTEHLRASTRLTRYGPACIGLALFLAWMAAFGIGTDHLEKWPRWDLMGKLNDLGLIGLFLGLLPGLGMATLVGVAGGLYLDAYLIRRAFWRRLAAPQCLFCGYSLRGSPPSNSTRRCPECGRCSPVYSADTDGRA